MDMRQNVDVQMRRQHGAQHYGTLRRAHHGTTPGTELRMQYTHIQRGKNYRYAFFRLEERYNERREFLPSLGKSTFTFTITFILFRLSVVYTVLCFIHLCLCICIYNYG